MKRVHPALLFLLFLAALAAPPPAVARSLVIESFDAEIYVYPDGAIDVTETIRPRFTGQWSGIYRSIPVEYRTAQGLNYTLRFSLTEITDGEGNPLRHEVSRERHYRKFKIWVPGASDATRTVRIRYRVRNGLRFFDEHDELYWNVTGDEWAFPIKHASASVSLPSQATGVRATAYTGAFGSSAQEAEVAASGTSVRVAARRVLSVREGLTIAVAWDKGAVTEPGFVAKLFDFLFSNWPLFVPIGVFAFMYWLWDTRGRDPRRRAIVTRYEPPAGLGPSEIGTLIDNSPDMRDITAILVNLAVQGYITIEEKQESKLLGLTTATEYVFRREKERSEWKDLRAQEKEVMIGLFGPGGRSSVKMSQLENDFYTVLPAIKDGIFQRLMDLGYYDHRPDKVMRTYLVAAIAVGVLAVWGGQFIAAILGISYLTFIIAGVASALIIGGFGWIMPARTMAGARALEGVLGFEEFLSRVEGHRMQTMIKTPEMFEKFLPYAMALGVEGKWAAAFDDICKEPPRWYRGYAYGPHFHMHGFTHNLSTMGTRAGSAMATAPRSSGGSGFGGGGGGGFSGGGFGGGGGGGF